MKGLYWVRQDLRLADNKTLTEFCIGVKQGLFVAAETRSLKRATAFRRQFYEESISEFNKSLKNKNQQVLRTKNCFPDFLELFLQNNHIDVLYFSNEHAVEEIREEMRVLEICRSHLVDVRNFRQSTLVSETDLPFTVKNMPFVFTSFRKKVEDSFKVNPVLPEPQVWPQLLSVVTGTENLIAIPAAIQSNTSNFTGGEGAARDRLKHYIWDTKSVVNYKETRNGLLDLDDSMKISPWLNSGCISARTIYAEIKKFEAEVLANDSTYWVVFELLWRDYFKFFSSKYGSAIFKIQGVNSDKKYSYHKNEKLFKNWCLGQTQETFINANMKELNATGWMSNRGRQNVASYLIHDLRLPWTWGAAYLEEMLIDYDPDLNWGNWLYLSGQGSDPRARKFNIERQASMYDANGIYQNRWS